MSIINFRFKTWSKPLIVGAILLPLNMQGSLLAMLPGGAGTKEEAASVSISHVSAAEVSPLAETFLGTDTPLAEVKAIVDEQKEFVSSRAAYPASLAVITKYEDVIRAYARKYDVPADVAIGVGLLENGGSATAVSSAGALGIFQLMPSTARSLGLTVNKSVDERRDPEKNIDAGISYLRKNYDRFGDWGLSVWAYHAGEGNVVKALQIYAKANDGIDLPGIEDFSAHRRYVEEHTITIDDLLSDPDVQEFTDKLNDDSSGYPYKVIATAKLFRESKI